VKKQLYSTILITTVVSLMMIFLYFLYKKGISPFDSFFTFLSIIGFPVFLFLTTNYLFEKFISTNSRNKFEDELFSILMNNNNPIPTLEEDLELIDVDDEGIVFTYDDEQEDEHEMQNKEEVEEKILSTDINSNTESKKETDYYIKQNNEENEIISNNELPNDNLVKDTEIKSSQENSITHNKKFSARKVDWEKVNQLKNDIGKVGEEIAVQYFKTIYKEVKHASLFFDGLGYDLELIDNENQEFYAEIKTTTKEFGQNIFMSQNEVDFMNNNPDKFILCIVHDLNLDNKEAEIKIVSGKEEINNFFDFEAQSFSISFK
jgi:hypothetical protein